MSRKSQHGFTLIECMIALTLGMLVIAAATALLLTAQQTYLAIDDSARIDDAGASALTALKTAIRQAAYADRSGMQAAPNPPPNALFGIDNAVPASRDEFDLRSRSRPAGINGSDILVTRFMATDTAGKPAPYMLNCAGNMLKKTATQVDREAVYNWSIFYIARSASGETKLLCRYLAETGRFSADAIVHGVEAMQFLYGVDRNGDGLPESFFQAAAIHGADWAKVTAISIALSIHGAASSSNGFANALQTDAAADIRHLFGEEYSMRHGAGDPGVRLDIARLRPGERKRIHRTVRAIVMLRNRPHGDL
ncbi:MAG TPA: PilW family protein [Herbaspirillum sp.]|jgi:type IV pilus assembly protein PilW